MTSIVVTPASPSIAKGATQQFTGMGTAGTSNEVPRTMSRPVRELPAMQETVFGQPVPRRRCGLHLPITAAPAPIVVPKMFVTRSASEESRVGKKT